MNIPPDSVPLLSMNDELDKSMIPFQSLEIIYKKRAPDVLFI